MDAVLYPFSFSICGNVISSRGSSQPTILVLIVDGYLPVRIEALDGVQVGEVTMQFSNLAPCEESWSIFGVFTVSFP
jgi:hypothetical protein